MSKGTDMNTPHTDQPSPLGTIDRRAFVAQLLAHTPQALVVTGLGSATYDVFASGDSDRYFYLWGAMGGALPIGLGLALAQPQRQVLVVTGDGEQLMGMGALATAAAPRARWRRCSSGACSTMPSASAEFATSTPMAGTARGTDAASIDALTASAKDAPGRSDPPSTSQSEHMVTCPIAWASPNVAPARFERSTVKISLGSSVTSPVTSTVMTPVVASAGIVSVPEVAV